MCICACCVNVLLSVFAFAFVFAVDWFPNSVFIIDRVYLLQSVCSQSTVAASSTACVDELMFWLPCLCDGAAQAAGTAERGVAGGAECEQQTHNACGFVAHNILTATKCLGDAWPFVVAMTRSALARCFSEALPDSHHEYPSMVVCVCIYITDNMHFLQSCVPHLPQYARLLIACFLGCCHCEICTSKLYFQRLAWFPPCTSNLTLSSRCLFQQ